MCEFIKLLISTQNACADGIDNKKGRKSYRIDPDDLMVGEVPGTSALRDIFVDEIILVTVTNIDMRLANRC